MDNRDALIAVVIPCYRVRDRIGQVISGIGPEVRKIYCVDDHCPEKSGDYILQNLHDPRVQVIFHEKRQGVGGATVTGFTQALGDHADIIVKLDGDGQMDPKAIPVLINPIVAGKADYTKGNRFYRIEDLQQMPVIRLCGNTILSFFSKISTGYWEIFDPTNGYTAIHAKVLALLPLDKVNKGYFYESDLLFRLNTVRAVVMDVPMKAIYGDEASNLSIMKAVPEFFTNHVANFAKRIFYVHFLRSFDLASLYLVTGIPLFLFGFAYGLYRWIDCANKGIPATAGTVMLAGLPLLLGVQFFISFFHYDMLDTPRQPLHTRM
jgi:glycosyltransferase involved in cell wall biosynthesis